jgi:ribosomal protein S18 acetylase RimI-like enzyme
MGGAGGWHDRRLSVGEISIRVATAADADAVVRLWAVARTEHAVTEDRPEAVRLLLESDEESLWVAECDGAIVGAVIAAWDGWRGNIYRLAIESKRRRSGIGTALVKAGERSLRRRGANRVTALVAFEDEGAGSFWDENGYPIDSEIGRRVRNL